MIRTFLESLRAALMAKLIAVQSRRRIHEIINKRSNVSWEEVDSFLEALRPAETHTDSSTKES